MGETNYYSAQIDIEGTVAELLRRAVSGLNATLDTVTIEKAQKHAPVRAFIRRTPRGRRLRSVALAPGATQSALMQAYRNRPIKTKAAFDKFTQSQPRPRRINIPSYGAVAHGRLDQIDKDHQDFINSTIPSHTQREGHNNSFMPVVRSKGRVVSGDFRRVSGGKLVAVAFAEKSVRGGRVQIRLPKLGEASDVEDTLTAKARYDIKTGKAGFSEIKNGRLSIAKRRGLHESEGELRYGGALRDSIKVIRASLSTREGRGRIMGYVRAGGDGVDYAGYQEFGTSHNRPHPFLRPALYESRGPFKKNVKAFLEGR